MRVQDETQEEHRAAIAKFAADAFHEHTLTEEAPQRWLCAKPGTGIYAFRVCLVPGAILVYGDIGDMLLVRFGGAGLDWLRGAVRSRDYLLGKVPVAHRGEVFLRGEAERVVKEMEDAGHSAADALRDALDDELEDDGPHAFYRAYAHNVDSDVPDCADFSSELHWCAEALAWFVRTLDAAQSAPTTEAQR